MSSASFAFARDHHTGMSKPRHIRSTKNNTILCLLAAVVWFATVRYVWAWDEHVSPFVREFLAWFIPSNADVVAEAVIQQVIVNAFPAFALSIPLTLMIESRHRLRWVSAFAVLLSLIAVAKILEIPPLLLEPSFVVVYTSPAVAAIAGGALVMLWKRLGGHD